MSKTIEDILKDMPLDESVKADLKEAWDAALADAKVAQVATVREEISGQYDNDLSAMQEAFGLFLEERIRPHVTELQEGVEAVDGMKQRYAEKTAKVKEAAQSHVRKHLAALEQVVEARVKAELSELHEDVVANRRAALNAITEQSAKLEAERVKFRAKAAGVLENIINVKVPKELEPLREDIMAAREDNFGREMYEAFATTFRRQFFNTSSEFQKLLAENKGLKESEARTKAKATKLVKESRESELAARKAYNGLTESISRQHTIARLVKPLSGSSRVQMKALLEATKTDKLEGEFRKNLPLIMRESTVAKPSKKKKLQESSKKSVVAIRTGNQPLNESDYDMYEDEINDIQRRAGNQK